MTDFETTAIVLVLVITALVTLFAWRRRQPPGNVSVTIHALAGAAVIALLWRADVPPDWFDGSGEGWWIALTFLAMAFVGGKKIGDMRPFLVSAGIALVALNVWAHV